MEGKKDIPEKSFVHCEANAKIQGCRHITTAQAKRLQHFLIIPGKCNCTGCYSPACVWQEKGNIIPPCINIDHKLSQFK
jgi:hypothetical protein